MITKPRFVTIDTQDFTDGKVPVWNADDFKFEPGNAATGITTISGNETITDLDIGSATEIFVDHVADANFELCEYPRVVAPVGVRVTVLASGIDGNNTKGSQFVLLIENVSYATDGGYGDPSPDIPLSWTRIGQVAV